MAAHEALPGAGSSDRRNVFSSRATLNRQRRMQRAEQRSFLVAPMLTVVRSVFSVLFPSECRLCSIPLTNISRLPVCPECLDSIEPIRVPQCVQCGERLLPAQLLRGDGRCQGCHEFEPQFDRAVSYAEYAGALRGLIHLLKYDRVLPAAPVLASMLAEAITQLDRDGSAAAAAGSRPTACEQARRARIQPGGADRARGRQAVATTSRNRNGIEAAASYALSSRPHARRARGQHA